MRVFLDTNAFFNQNDLRQIHWERLAFLIDAEIVQAATSEVVVKELVRQWRRSYIGRRDKLRATIQDLNDMGVATDLDPSRQLTADPADETEAYNERLRHRLEQVGIEVVPLSDVSHEVVLDRDLSKRKPFTDTGKGYRDALIWHGFLDWVSLSSDDATFVSENTGDFANDKKTGLHDTLVQELPVGVNVIYAKDGRTAIEDLWKTEDGETLLSHARNATESFGTSDVENATRLALVGTVDRLVGVSVGLQGDDSASVRISGYEPGPWPEGAEIMWIEAEDNDLELSEDEDFGSGTTYYTATIPAQIGIEGAMHKFEAYDSGYTVTDSDLNRYYASVATTLSVFLHFEVRYEAVEESAYLELTSIESADL
ncbi:PIN domain-containing protein [Leifsonia aquatica]|uniref:PIN domain-containing protein n=1 Tax=Leifsonia aquatica TaxID=144185 RepID=UPI003802C378